MADRGQGRKLSVAGIRQFAAQLLSTGPLAEPTNRLPGAQTQKPGGLLIPRRRLDWQKEGYGYYDDLAPIHYAHTYIGNAASKAVLEPAQLNPDGVGSPIPVDAEGDAIPADMQSLCRAVVDRLGEQSEMNRLGCTNLSIAGESLVVFQNQGGQELITPRSVLEVKSQGGTTVIGGDGITGGTEIGPDDDVLRIWKTHPGYAQRADSWMIGVRDDCLELLLLNREIRAKVTSRLASAGLLLLPNGMSLGPIDPTNSYGADDLIGQLTDAMAMAIQTPGDARGIIPLMLQGEGDLLDKVRFLTMEHTIDTVSAAQREEKLRIIAVGADLPPEILTGKADLNHWTGAIVDDNTNSSHIVPLVGVWADGLTDGYYRPSLLAAGMPAAMVARMVLKPNFSALVVRPNRAQDAKDAHTALTLSDEALRKYLGFIDDDAPRPEEVARRMAQKGKTTMDAPIAEALLQYLLPGLTVLRDEPPGSIQITDAPSEPTPPGENVAAGDEPSTAPAEDAPAAGDLPAMPASAALTASAGRSASYRLGARLTQIDRTLRTRVVTASDSALSSALRRAGNVVDRKAQSNSAARALLADVPRKRAAATLGRGMVAALKVDPDGLIGDDDWSELLERFQDWTTDAQEQILALVAGWLGLSITDPQIVAASAALADHRDRAAAALVAQMTALANSRLYDPSPDAPADGEHDTAMSVPVGMIRTVLSIAGGSPDGLPDPVDNVPAGGISQGATVIQLFGDNGVNAEGYTWSWGGSAKPFPPHEDLDGVDFADWSDPVLTNGEGWPEALSSPGDHSGCSCDAIPQMSVYSPAGRAVDAEAA